MGQYDVLALLPPNRQPDLVLPAWLAEYSMASTFGFHITFDRLMGQILALAIKLGIVDSLIPFLPMHSRITIQELPAELYRCSLRALEVANYLNKPQIRHIQVKPLSKIIS